MTTTQHTSTTHGPLSILDLACVDYNRHKPTFTELREEGLSQYAIESLIIGREGLGVDPAPGAAAERLAEGAYGEVAEHVADFLRLSQRAYPIDVDDVWPNGIPEQWVDWANYDPTDAELEQAWNGPDAPAVHRAAWALHQGLHDRSAS